MEVLNEVTSILLLYHMFTFTDWVPGATTRYMLGWSFIAVTCTNLGIHFLNLGKNSFSDIKRKCMYKYQKLSNLNENEIDRLEKAQIKWEKKHGIKDTKPAKQNQDEVNEEGKEERK